MYDRNRIFITSPVEIMLPLFGLCLCVKGVLHNGRPVGQLFQTGSRLDRGSLKLGMLPDLKTIVASDQSCLKIESCPEENLADQAFVAKSHKAGSV